MATTAPTRRRRVLKWVGVGVGTVVLVAGGIAYWAIDEYIIDHVEIGDVAAYEAARSSSSVSSVASSAATAATVAALAAAAATTAATTAAATTQATAAAATATPPTASGADPVVTATSYVSDTTSISIEKVTTGTGTNTVTYYVADVVVDDATAVRSGFANNKYGENIIADTSTIAQAYDAIFAINGDYYGFRDDGIMIRNGVVYRDEGKRMGLALYADGRMVVYDETTTSAAGLLADGVWNTLSFGPAVVDDGRIPAGITDFEVDTNVGNHSIQGNQPRTALGVISPNHFVFVVVDGRSRGYSRGVTLTELGQIFLDRGATEAYNLDGGGSSTMYFNGALVNSPLGKGNERGTSDILYVA